MTGSAAASNGIRSRIPRALGHTGRHEHIRNRGPALELHGGIANDEVRCCRSIHRLTATGARGRNRHLGGAASSPTRLRIAAFDGPTPSTKFNSVIVANPDALAEERPPPTSDVPRPVTAGPPRRNPVYREGRLYGHRPDCGRRFPCFRGTYAPARGCLHRGTPPRRRGICLGLTNMPPMADGDMQRGLYGRAESPYNPEWLTSAFTCGSSNGSGTRRLRASPPSVSARGVLVLGTSSCLTQRTHRLHPLSRSRSPCAAICSLVPTMDVVVPHTRSMADLLQGSRHHRRRRHRDSWRFLRRVQTLGRDSRRFCHPPRFLCHTASQADAEAAHSTLAGRRFGIPKMYINAAPEAGTNPDGGIGGPTGQRVETRASVIAAWETARRDLEAAGAEVVETDFPSSATSRAMTTVLRPLSRRAASSAPTTSIARSMDLLRVGLGRFPGRRR